MRLLDRYLLRELLVPLGYCLGGFLIFWVAFDLIGNLHDYQEKKMLVQDIAEYYLVLTPEFLVLVLPIALLLALLYALTNHARHNEITAIRAAGVSLWRLCLPYLVVGLLVSLGSFALNELWVPKSTEAGERILARRVPPKPGAPGPNEFRNLAFTNTREGRSWIIPTYNLETTEMTKPKVFSPQADGSTLWLEAQSAIYANGIWTFYNASVHREAAETNSWPVPILETNVLAMPAFSETPEEIKSEITIQTTISLRNAKKADIPIAEIRNYKRLHPKPLRSVSFWLDTKLQGRLATPWACLVVVLVAIPFGAASGRRNAFVGVASSIFICFAYFVLQQFGLALGSGGYLPAWLAAWFPNISFGATGLFLAAKLR
jgi:lipopolysaccharide export system permease protein